MPIQIIPKAESFGEEFARAIGGGFSKGTEQATQQKMAREAARAEEEQKQRMLEYEYGLKGGLEQEKQDIKLQNKLELLKKFPSFQEKLQTKEPTEILEDEKSLNTPPHTQEEIDAMSLFEPNTAKIWQSQNKQWAEERRHKEQFEQTQFQKDREYHTQFSKPILESARKTLEVMPARRGLMNQWKRDIASGNTSGLGQFMVEKTGLEFWRSPESARAKTAAKEYFVEGLGSLSPGARPNIFIEQQLSSALPTIGRDKESGLTVLEMQDFLDDLKDQKARLVEQLAEEDMEKYGYVKEDVARRAQKQLEPYAEERQNKLAYNIRKIHEDQLDERQLTEEIVMGKIPPTTPLTERSARILMIKNNDDIDAAIREAQRLGFTLPKKK